MATEGRKVAFGMLKLIFVLAVGLLFVFSLVGGSLFNLGNTGNYYEVRDERGDKSQENFDRLMRLCGEMTDVPKKDKCFILIAEGFSGEPEMASPACDAVMEFDNVHTKEKCRRKASLEAV